MKVTNLLISALNALILLACAREGGIIQLALNFDSKERSDDGNCIYYKGLPGIGSKGPNNPQLPYQLTGIEANDRILEGFH